MTRRLLAIAMLVGCAKPATSNPPDGTAGSDAGVEPDGVSIQQWTTCDGVTDDSIGAAKAFEAASGGAFTLLVDCPVKIHIGSDIARPIFVEPGTSVTFWGNGKIILDNLFVPSFVLANTTDVTLTNWNVEWDGSLPVDPAIGGYYKDGVFIAQAGGNGAGVFNDTVLTPWLTAHRGIVFDQSLGRVTSQWSGPVNIGALFLLIGDTSNVRVTGMHLYAPAEATGDQFIPFCFSFETNYKSNQRVTAMTATTTQYRERPHDLVFSNIDLDGTYMVFQGGVHDATFDHIHSGRYGDVQDANGGTSGGIGKWFPPPHLFYLNYAPAGDPSMFNTNIQIHDVVDDGVRSGVARDKGGADTVSGYALSLKLGCHQCSVDGYVSKRPDGFMDVLSSDGLTVSNVDASYDSTFLNGVFPGWRFPQSPYANVTFDHVALVDTAPQPARAPIGGAGNATNVNLEFTNVAVALADWATPSTLIPAAPNQGIDSEIEFDVASVPYKLVAATSRSVSVSLEASPSRVSAGVPATVTWTSKGATTCSPSGAWSGTLAANGSQAVMLPAGTQAVVLSCSNATDTIAATVHVTVVP